MCRKNKPCACPPFVYLFTAASRPALYEAIRHAGEAFEGDTLVILATFPTLDSVECTISASRLIDVRGEVAAYQQRLVEKVAGQGVMVKLTIPIYEVTA